MRWITLTLAALLFLAGCVEGNQLNTSSGTPAVIDCGSNTSCFMEALKECKNATFRTNISLDWMGVIINKELEFRLESKPEGCALEQKTLRLQMRYTEEVKEQLRTQHNLTDDQIREMERNMSRQALQEEETVYCIFKDGQAASTYLDFVANGKGKLTFQLIQPGNRSAAYVKQGNITLGSCYLQ